MSGSTGARPARAATTVRGVEILSSRAILRPTDPDRSVAFYRDVLGLAISREFPGGTVFFLGGGFLEVSAVPAGTGAADGGAAGGASHDGSADGAAPDVGGLRLWLQVRDLAAAHRELAAAGVPILREPREEPWGLHEMWVADPDGTRLVLVQIPAGHPIRRDTRADRTQSTGTGAAGPA